MGELKKVFRPELLNRIDEVIVFHKLSKDEITQIVDLLMKRLREQMAEHEVSIELTETAVELLAEQGLRPDDGRPAAAPAIQRLIEDPLADFVLSRTLTPGATIVIDREEGSTEVTLKVVEPKAETPPPEPAGVAGGASEGGEGSGES